MPERLWPAMHDQYLTTLESKARENGLSKRLWLSRARVSESTFYRWKNGQTKDAKLSTIRRLERALETKTLTT